MKQVQGAGGGGGCFTGRTLVGTPKGPTAIEKLKEGDLVLRFDDCGNPIFDGLDDFDREVAEGKLMQLNAMEKARLWLRRIEIGEIK